jgi:hypothetical protein
VIWCSNFIVPIIFIKRDIAPQPPRKRLHSRKGGKAMFDLDRFIAECRAAVSLDPTHKSVREIVARAVSEPTAVIAEDNIFGRRLPGQDGARIEAAGAKSLGERDVEALGRDIIHTGNQPAAAIDGRHPRLRRGFFFCRSRSEWDPETLLEQPFDMEKNLRLFEQANARHVWN